MRTSHINRSTLLKTRACARLFSLNFFGLLFILLPVFCLAQPGNDLCGNATTLSVGNCASPTTGTTNSATVSGTDPGSGTCGGTVRYDVWYKFTAQSANPTITLSGVGVQFLNPRIQVLSGACGGMTIQSCGASPHTTSGLTVGTLYYIRVFSTTNPVPLVTGGFSICIADPPPANDNCTGAVTLTETATCSPTFGSLQGATNSGIAVGACSGTPDDDIWFKFVATSTHPTVLVDDIGQNLWNLGGPRMQLFSGSCGTLTSIACGGPYTISPSGLTIGNTYFVRVYSLNSGPPPSGSSVLAGFTICVTDPQQADIEFSKSYVNVNKSLNGGTVAPGDTLEIRATLVILSQVVDSLAFYDTLFHSQGMRLVPNSISLRTNEGVLYKGFSDLADGDAGKVTTFGSTDTAILMNIGIGASNVAKGKLRNTSKPSFYDKACIMMATYKVVVYAPYDTKINFGGGAFTFLDTSTAALRRAAFKSDSIMVYQSPGLCPNAVSATNAIGVESNGSFGAPATGAPLARNRSVSTYVPNYSYSTFSQTSGPDDYYYGLTNNTSSRFATANTYTKPDNNSPNYRQFAKWDIIGDHTGATNTAKGNPPCDTTKAISATNPCGYMLVINSSYRTDTAFQYSVTNLCPNTYYELSTWIKNICSFCACDSNGNPADDGTFIPSVAGDSSGVQPNLAFEINGTDYFTTGNIKYSGTRGPGSDSTNKWVKRGFVYKTGPAETAFILAIRNNAPGGGGNDWAIDDISLATCIPDMNYYPSSTANVCRQNAMTVYDTVSSFYNNYVYYKWQKSTDAGATWSDITGTAGPISPTFNPSTNAWEYLVHYVIPPANTNTINNGDRYRVVAATTSSNLGTSNCIVTDGTSFLTLNVMNCGTPLKTDMLSFNGKLVNDKGALTWSTSQEEVPVKYQVERSSDAVNFFLTGIVDGYNNSSNLNQYSFTDALTVIGKVFYRLTIVDNAGNKKTSRIIQLNSDKTGFTVNNLVNPFANELVFDLIINNNKTIDATLLDMAGKPVRKKSYSVYAGVNNLHIDKTESLKPGIYLLQVTDRETIVTTMILKK